MDFGIIQQIHHHLLHSVQRRRVLLIRQEQGIPSQGGRYLMEVMHMEVLVELLLLIVDLAVQHQLEVAIFQL